MPVKKRKEKEWQKLCESVADEHNPKRLSKLVDQLIEKLDARRQALRKSKRERIRLRRKA
jgi:hypothetical protein